VSEYIKNAMRTLGGKKSGIVARFADSFYARICHSSLAIA
jgi:hypothetical protein